MPILDNRWPDEKWQNRIWSFFNVFSVYHQHKEYRLCLLRIQLLERKRKSKQTRIQLFKSWFRMTKSNLCGKTQESVFLSRPYQNLWDVFCINLSVLLLTGWGARIHTRRRGKAQGANKVTSWFSEDSWLHRHCALLYITSYIFGDCIRKTDVRRARKGEDAGCRNLLY